MHLLPGLPALLAFTVFSAAFASWGLPNLLALMLATLLVEAPVTWLIMLRVVKKESGGPFRFSRAFPWREPLAPRIYLLFGVPALIFSIVMLGGVGPMVDKALLAGPFHWVPAWFALQGGPEMFSMISRATLLAMWGLMLISFVLIGGVTQELYFRGFLLPRIEHLGKGAPLLNAALFAAFHLVAPWSWPVFFIMTLPWAYLVWWRRSVRIGLFIHVGMLFVQWLLFSLLLFGFIQLPDGNMAGTI